MNKSIRALPAREKDDAGRALDLLCEDPNHPSLQLHPVRRGKSDFYTVRMSKGGRLVIHISKDTILVCKAFSSGHHDDAYKYARTRVLKKSGSGLEYVSVVDRVTYENDYRVANEPKAENNSSEAAKKTDVAKQDPLFFSFSDDQIEKCGVTYTELELIKTIKSEQELFLLEDSISPLAHDNLVALYLGDELPNKLIDGELIPDSNEFGFIEYDGSEEIKVALSESWSSWLVFLSNSQKQIVSANFNGASKVFGGAGTGKTVVALHRAKHLAETAQISTSRGIGLLTFSKVLANDLVDKADLLMGRKTTTRQKVFVGDLDQLARKAMNQNFELTTENTIKTKLTELHKKYNLMDQFTPEFIFSEYMNVVGPWGLTSFDKYKNFQRLGRQTPLHSKQREILSNLYVEFDRICNKIGLITHFQLYQKATKVQLDRGPIFDHIILDETQDLGPHMLAFVRSLVSKKPNDIMLCGDTGQSLYTRHHSFRKHGFAIQGRSKKLYVNYRTSRQIKESADKVNEFLIELSDEPNESRRSISIFDGPKPLVKLFSDRDSEVKNLLSWIKKQIGNGIQPHEIVVLTPNDLAMSVASKEMKANKIRNWKLDATANYLNGEVGLATVSRVKGLEYRSVAIIGCDEDQFPNSKKLNELGDESDFDEFLTLEKNSLYVAMTRARDNLLLSGVTPGSAFLEELN